MDHRNFFYKLIYERHSSPCQPVSLYNAAKNNLYLLQRMCLEKKLNVHSGCVNTICWNSTGQYLLSGSDDLHLCITDAFTNEIKASIRTGHATNIFSAKYLPGTADSQVISCSGDGVIIYTDLLRPDTSTKNIFDCQEESVYDIATVPNDSHTFLTCSHDQTVRWYDLRVKTSCLKHHPSHSRYGRSSLLRQSHRCMEDVLIRAEHPVTAIAVNGLMPWQLAIGCSDSIVRIYDRRMLSTRSLGGVGCGTGRQVDSSVLAKFTYDGISTTNRITSLAYSRNCQQLLASFSNDFLYLFDLNDVRNTIKLSAEEDIIPDKSDRPNCAFKRFRLRGDWSDTGPNALTSDEIRAANSGDGGDSSTGAAADQLSAASTAASTSTAATTSANSNSTTTSNSLAARAGSSASSAAGGTSSSSSSASSSSASSATPNNNNNNTEQRTRTSEARIRHLNNILSLFLRSSFGGSGSSRSSSLLESLSMDSPQRNSRAASSASEPQRTTSAAAAAAVSNDTSTTGASSHADPSPFTAASTSTGAFRPPSSSANMDEDSGNAQAGDINNSASSYAPEQPAFYIRLFDDSDWGGGNSNSSSSGQPGGYWRRNTDAGSQGSNSPIPGQVSGRLEVEVAEEEEAAAVVEPEHEAEDNTLENELMMDDGDEGELGEDSDTTNDSVFHRHPAHPSSRHPRSAGTSRTSRSSSSNDSWHQQYRQTSSRFGTVHEASHRPQAMAENYGEDEDDDDEMEGHSMKYRRTEESVEREKRLKTYKIKNYQIFKGHRNARTVIKEATFWGDDYIVSGSDCGHIFFWSVKDQRLVMITEGDHHVVNCLQPHPTDPILASSGIDYDIKIWSPQSEESMFDEKKAKKIMDRNKTLLEESRDTVTVPARFVLSLFSTLSE